MKLEVNTFLPIEYVVFLKNNESGGSMKDRYPGSFVLDCVIIVHTTMGPFKLVHGKWLDGIGQPAPGNIIADLDFAHEQKSRPTGLEKVRFDKGDSL